MRIVQVVTQMEGGGAQRCAILAGRSFRQQGHDAETWFLFRRRGVYDEEPNIRCIFPSPPASVADYFVILFRLFQSLREHRPDVLIAYTHYSNVIGCILGALSGIRIRGARKDGLPQRAPCLARICDLFAGTLGFYSAVLANSHATAAAFRQYPGLYKKRLHVVPNGVVIPVVRLDRASARQRFRLPNDAFVVAIAGRLAKVKNHGRLLKALALTSKDIHLIVAGDGKERDRLLLLISDLDLMGRVTLVGDIPADNLGDVFIAADAYIQPSLWEGFGLAPLEAAGSGLATAVSDIPAMREVMGEPEQGNTIYFDPQDVDSIAESLNKLRGDAALRSELARRGKDLARAYPVEAMTRGFLDVLVGGGD